MAMTGGCSPDWKADVDAATAVLDAARVPTTPVECDTEEHTLSLAERVQLLVNSRDNHEGASRFKASQLSKLRAAFRNGMPLNTIVVCAASLEEAAAIISAMQAASKAT